MLCLIELIPRYRDCPIVLVIPGEPEESIFAMMECFNRRYCSIENALHWVRVRVEVKHVMMGCKKERKKS